MADDITPKYPIVPMSDSVTPLDEGFGAKIGGYGGLGGTLAKDVEAATATVEETINSDGNFINDVINARLDSSSKKILSDFDFGTTDYAGAVKTGDITWNTTTGAITGGSGVAIYRGGIVGANAGVTTFSIDAATGDATFAGELSSPSGTIGGFIAGADYLGNATTQANSTVTLDATSGIFVGNYSNLQLVMSVGSQHWEFQYNETVHAFIDIDATLDIVGISVGDVNPIKVLFNQISANSGVVRPESGDTVDLGNATTFWNDVSYKTLTDRGCLGWFDDGVELQDGTIVSDTEALLAIRKHPTKKTIYGKPMLDYSSLPKVVYKPATDGKGNLYKRGKDGEPLPFKEDGKEVYPQDGAETTSLISIILGATKESALEIITLKKEIAQLKEQLAQ